MVGLRIQGPYDWNDEIVEALVRDGCEQLAMMLRFLPELRTCSEVMSVRTKAMVVARQDKRGVTTRRSATDFRHPRTRRRRTPRSSYTGAV